MDLVGEFNKVEIDGKPFLIYQNVMKSLPDIPISQTAMDSGDGFLPTPLFLCPRSRVKRVVDFAVANESWDYKSKLLSKFETSPLFDNTNNGHHVLPLFWCNNKEVDPENRDCDCCSIKRFYNRIGTDYYFCVECDKRFHKECVESPLEISHPSHPKHSLQLYYSILSSDHCSYCKKNTNYMHYYCVLCNNHIHIFCAQAKIPFFLDEPKRHDHTLTLFPRQAFLPCNICGLVNKLFLTYVCALCDFVAHNDCINIPQTIRISRHSHHRVSFTSSLPLGKWSCGVCRRGIDSDYGAYTCSICSGYAVHTRCALRKDIWDGIELEGVPEDEDLQPPFERIADGTILHFSHGCNLKLETNIGVYDDKQNFCQACVLPIYEENFYVCEECSFILHERCAAAPLKIVHPLHPHTLELKVVHENLLFFCGACKRPSGGFAYDCTNEECGYTLDVVCGSVCEPFNYQGHLHPLYLAIDPEEKPICHICMSTEVDKVLNCIECDFIICFKCATLPYMVKYKHDDHYLIFCRGVEASDADWCELCEKKIVIGGEEGFYYCKSCCTTLHIECLLGPRPYIKSGLIMSHDDGGQMFCQRNNSASRPICGVCDHHCPYPIYWEHREGAYSTFFCEQCVLLVKKHY